MYLQHFGLREFPFSLTPDTEFFYEHPGHRAALNVLLVALRSGEGVVAIGGEVGTGKTLLCRMLLDALEGECATAYLPNPLLTPRELYRTIATEFALHTPTKASEHELLAAINRFLLANAATGRRVVVCLDEAQAMPLESLEALRLLSNLETEKRKLVQIVLFGQPELFARLQRHELRQLRQRITFTHTLQPLGRADLPGYVGHRLRVAGHRDGALFTAPALDRLYRASRGVPRRVNTLCHKALLAAYGEGGLDICHRQVTAAVADDLGAGSFLDFSRRRWAIGLVTLTQLAIVTYLVWEASR